LRKDWKNALEGFLSKKLTKCSKNAAKLAVFGETTKKIRVFFAKNTDLVRL
jgi:hypothetical protein